MKERLCIIFGAGAAFPPKIKPREGDLVIAADGGYATAKNFGVEPSVIVGDFDSSEVPTGIAAHVIKLNPDKDDTDTIAAVKLGLRRGYKNFVLYGGVGGRLDHTVANFATLSYLNAFGAKGYLIDRDAVATVITDDKLVIPKNKQGTVSVFAYGGEASGVSLKNLTYELNNATLSPDFPLGVSNSVKADGTRGEISVKSGSLLIFFPR